ncbi:transposase, partial [Butyrivibrio sp. VCB2001]|uniref:transposase n=2 Tax=Butyrivibrio sp. VCB2001 TaxID=1280667 RepID=UPI000479F724
MTVMVLPNRLRIFHRTSNHIERLNRELKRRSKVIGVFPNEASVIRIMGSVLMDVHETFASVHNYGYPTKLLQSIDDYIPQLKEIADEQLKLLAA